MNAKDQAPAKAPEAWILGDKSLGQVTREVAGPLAMGPTWVWWAGFIPALLALIYGGSAMLYEVSVGEGVIGLNKTVGWGFLITDFVFWVGIGHAGTLISAILLLLRQRWRTSVNRSAEAMTLIAICCAGLFPLLHVGRPWFCFWLIPYPNSRGPLWINFRSALFWDMLAISTYATISLVFWYLGLVPDLATLRDRSQAGLKKTLYGLFSLGWDGSARAWNRFDLLYLLLAGLATPLVLSVHSVVSCDFATALIPGWHTTILPPYFVAGAIFSGFAMVLTLMIVARKTMRFEDYITRKHIDAMAKVVLLTSCFVATAYLIEIFVAWYSGDRWEQFTFLNRFFGPQAWSAYVMYGCNMLMPQLLWFKKIRSNLLVLFIMSILINVGMWFERFVIIVGSLQRDFLPSSWANYRPTLFDFSILFGSFGLFFTLFLLFCRFLPMIAIAEVKHEISHKDGHEAHAGAEAS